MHKAIKPKKIDQGFINIIISAIYWGIWTKRLPLHMVTTNETNENPRKKPLMFGEARRTLFFRMTHSFESLSHTNCYSFFRPMRFWSNRFAPESLYSFSTCRLPKHWTLAWWFMMMMAITRDDDDHTDGRFLRVAVNVETRCQKQLGRCLTARSRVCDDEVLVVGFDFSLSVSAEIRRIGTENFGDWIFVRQ